MLATTFNSKPSDAPRGAGQLLAGETLGMRRIETSPYGDKEYMLVQVNAAITQGQAVKLDTSVVGAALGQTVIPIAAATDIPVGVYEGAIAGAATNYIWITIKGVVSVNVNGAVALGAPLSASATAGALQTAPFTAATAQSVEGVALQTNAAGTAAKLARLI